MKNTAALLAAWTSIASGLSASAPVQAQSITIVQTAAWDRTGNFGSFADKSYDVMLFTKFNPDLGQLVQTFIFGDVHEVISSPMHYIPAGGSYGYHVQVSAETAIGYGGTDPIPISWGQVGNCGATAPGQCLAGPYNINVHDPIGTGINGGSSLGGDILFKAYVDSGQYTRGTYQLHGQFEVRQTYAAKPTAQYLFDAWSKTSGVPTDRAHQAWADIALLRGHDAQTAATNLALRDAEYFMRGYSGGLRVGSVPLDLSTPAMAWHDFANRFGPVAATIYNNFKAALQIRTGNYTPINDHPASPSGGVLQDARGFFAGLNGLSFNAALNYQLLGRDVSTDNQNPTVPYRILDGETFEVGLFFIHPMSLHFGYIDPPVGQVMSYSFYGNTATELSIVTSLPGIFDLYFDSFHLKVKSGDIVDFKSYVPGGVNIFSFSNLPDYDPQGMPMVVGLKFNTTDNTFVSIFSGNIPAVPEECTAAYFLLGLAMISYLYRARWVRTS